MPIQNKPNMVDYCNSIIWVGTTERIPIENFIADLFVGTTWCITRNPLESKWVFPKIGVPQNGWFITENPIKIDDLGINS